MVKERALNTCGQDQTRLSWAGAGSRTLTHKLKPVKSCQLLDLCVIFKPNAFQIVISNPVLSEYSYLQYTYI